VVFVFAYSKNWGTHTLHIFCLLSWNRKNIQQIVIFHYLSNFSSLFFWFFYSLFFMVMLVCYRFFYFIFCVIIIYYFCLCSKSIYIYIFQFFKYYICKGWSLKKKKKSLYLTELILIPTNFIGTKKKYTKKYIFFYYMSIFRFLLVVRFHFFSSLFYVLIYIQKIQFFFYYRNIFPVFVCCPFSYFVFIFCFNLYIILFLF
jgi:hypothetical protein